MTPELFVAIVIAPLCVLLAGVGLALWSRYADH